MTTKQQKNIISTVEGVLDVSRSGTGFVAVPGLPEDVMVRQHDLGKALHGDKVQVLITTPDGQRPRGKITNVIQRSRMQFVGTITITATHAFFKPDSQRPCPDFFIPLSALNGAKDNNRVAVRMTGWDLKDKSPRGQVTAVLTGLNPLDLPMREILLERGFPLDIPPDAMAEAMAIPEVIPQEEITSRRDMRGVLTFTVDPDDAKDFDDSLSIADLPDGSVEVGVHIADVSYYVKPGTALDREAFERATSVYLADRVLPMLPERISNHLCSLRPHEDKLTFSCVFKFRDGKVADTWIGRTVTHSDHRFTYDQAQEIITGADGPHADALRRLDAIAKDLRAARFREGSIEFTSQEVRFRVDPKGWPVGVTVKESKDSHRMVEDLMLMANRAVAAMVSAQKPVVPFPYRTHDQPDSAKLSTFADFARNYGHVFETHTPEAIAGSFNRMLAAVKDKPERQVLEQLGVRTMAKASYTTDNIGHYGLGFDDYCHFTSPIRRYPDVMVHRIVEGIITGSPADYSSIDEQCRHCGERERAAMDAERAGTKLMAARYMSGFLGQEFDAVITGVGPSGFWAETLEHRCEGMVSLSSLVVIDDFSYDDKGYCLRGVITGLVFRMGDQVRITVDRVDTAKRQIDYSVVGY